VFRVIQETRFGKFILRIWHFAITIYTFQERREEMAILKGKKVIIIGDRDGVPGPAIQACVETAGGEVVFASTECFV